MKDNKEVQRKMKINNAEECIDEGEIAPDGLALQIILGDVNCDDVCA